MVGMYADLNPNVARGQVATPEAILDRAVDRVESELAGAGVFRQALVFGDARPYCTALLYPMDDQCSNAVIQDAIDRVNDRLPDYARVAAWARLPEPLSAARGLLTDNGRPRRNMIEGAYGHLIDTLYPETKEMKAL